MTEEEIADITLAEAWAGENGFDSDCNINSVEANGELVNAFLAGLKAKAQWHDLRKNPDDLPRSVGEDEQIIFYVKEWYENISKYRNHYCLGFYKKAFLNNDVKVFVEKSKGYENEHLPSTVLRWRLLEKWETE